MRNHTTHHDDCGCLTARYEARIATLEAELAASRMDAEAKLADERKHALDLMNRHRDEVLSLAAKLADERRHADDVAAGAELGGEFRLRVIAIHAARRAAEVGNA